MFSFGDIFSFIFIGALVHVTVGLVLEAFLGYDSDSVWKDTFVYVIKRDKHRIKIYLWELTVLRGLLHIADNAIRTIIVYAREVRRAAITVLKRTIQRDK